MEPDNEKRQPETDRDVFVKISDNSITPDDLISANEYGFHCGYMKALRHAALIVFACVVVGVIIEPIFERRF